MIQIGRRRSVHFVRSFSDSPTPCRTFKHFLAFKARQEPEALLFAVCATVLKLAGSRESLRVQASLPGGVLPQDFCFIVGFEWPNQQFLLLSVGIKSAPDTILETALRTGDIVY